MRKVNWWRWKQILLLESPHPPKANNFAHPTFGFECLNNHFIVGMILNGLIGRKGALSSLTEYWVVGQYLITCVLAKDTSRACQAIEHLYTLHPKPWYIQSLLKDIYMIHRFQSDINEQANVEVILDYSHSFSSIRTFANFKTMHDFDMKIPLKFHFCRRLEFTRLFYTVCLS